MQNPNSLLPTPNYFKTPMVVPSDLVSKELSVSPRGAILFSWSVPSPCEQVVSGLSIVQTSYTPMIRLDSTSVKGYHSS